MKKITLAVAVSLSFRLLLGLNNLYNYLIDYRFNESKSIFFGTEVNSWIIELVYLIAEIGLLVFFISLYKRQDDER